MVYKSFFSNLFIVFNKNDDHLLIMQLSMYSNLDQVVYYHQVLVSTCFMRCVSRSGSFIYIYCARGSCVTFTLPQVQN